MADESDTGPTRRRTGAKREDVHAIEREGQPADPVSDAGERQSDTEKTAIRLEQHGAALFPGRVARKYYVAEATRGSDERRVYADERGEYLVFKDQGHRLTTRRHEAAIVRDLVAIAEHRDWSALHVSGSEAFRRAVWLEASARGIDVAGHTPSQLDRAALTRRNSDRIRKSDRSGFGRGPADARASEQPAAFIHSTSASRAIRSAEATPRDRAEDNTRSEPNQARDDASRSRGPGAATDHDRFGRAPLGEAIKDEHLAAAHSQIAALDRALRRAFPDNAAVRDVVMDAARERIAFHVDRGRMFQRATYRLPEREQSGQRNVIATELVHDVHQKRRPMHRDREK